MSIVELGARFFPNPTKDQAIAGAKIYVGDPDTDPTVVGNQKTITALQEDGTEVELTQPVECGAGGVPLYDGEYVTLTVDGDYSIAVLSADDVQLFYIPSSYSVDAITSNFAKTLLVAANRAAFWTAIGNPAPTEDAELLEIDGDPAEGEYGKFTADGLTGESLADLKTALGITTVAPIGSVIMWTTGTPPTGYLECDGSAVSRSTYSDLFGVIDVLYGAGDGSTTFNLPDFRGKFVRGFDNGAGVDPDADSRTDRGDGTAGDYVGTNQDWAMKEHWHQYFYNQMNLGSGGTGLIITVGAGNNAPQTGKDAVRQAHEPEVGGDDISEVAEETRPINMSIMFCIKT
jgi:microcystin-dependent protein